MKTYIWLILLSGFLACTPSKTEIPADILPDSVMRNLIIGFSLADAAAMLNQGDKKFPPFKPELFYEAALKKEGIDRETLIRSLTFYGQHPHLLQKIYNSAITEAAQRQIKIKN